MKVFTTAISRDVGWQPPGELGFEPVRQIAIDDDWSVLRSAAQAGPPLLASTAREATKHIGIW